mmetsp:Transcript_15986/g.48012  ORF Transcript_15986/g.48012 Transcript_15986/m.48012 type:complete len:322 (-) Transcript_15986:170-1135(-)|eukprot:CAMPEP_0206138420 /NCGR_PEP_ID=MMETSP1473-20131121/3316_1 /ASSEMBLY_ACC=CAM_ASM_001109 /TAXON_ID=1461547 /ORGANISM="Stichococcus sp, Strain RCC1054" /LENGTH=321 /DNA_ID=CAMNT_0053531855 /DNA_START=190 /DNA_END=1155 /DNA_ORIENTATION=-
MSEITLYVRSGSAWRLPALTVAEMQVQAYLMLAGLEHKTVDVVDPASSRTGQLPALEHGAVLAGTDTADASEFETARQLLDYLAGVRYLDEALPTARRADVLRWTALAEARLEPATVYTTWCDDNSYRSATQVIYGAGLPFPLNKWLPWRARAAALKHFKSTTAAQVYEGAAAAYASLAQHLEELYPAASEVHFFLGDAPSTVDAVVYPHLLYHLRSPVAAPELRTQLQKYPVLKRYVDAVASATRSTILRGPPPPSINRQGTPNDEASDRPPTAAERRQKVMARIWLGSAVALVVGYAYYFGYFPGGDWVLEGEEDDDDM